VRLPENFDGQHLFRAACRYFALEEYRFEAADDRALPKKQSFQVITLLDGAMEVRTDGGDLRAEKGETVLIPAAGELSVSVEAGTHFLLSSVPDLRHEIVEPLRTAGVEPTRIALLGGNPARNDLASVVEI
jgi:hypothetical protein